MAGLFVTATGTGVGKTIAVCTLIHQLRARGQPVRAFKPVISGYAPDDPASDTALIARAMGGGVEPQTISPWRFGAPLSPDMAAAREGRRIEPAALVAFCEEAISGEGPALIEGVGGAFVPLAENFLVADWMAALGCPFLVVAGSYLGTLSHTIATLEALAARGLAPRAVLVSQSTDEPVPLEETAAALAARLRAPVRTLPRVAGAEPWRAAPDLTGLLGKP